MLLNEVISALEAQFIQTEQGMDSAISERAFAVNQYVAAVIGLAYDAGKMQGQQGNGFSNSDFENMMKQLQAGSSFKSVNANLIRLSKNYIQSQNMSARIQKEIPTIAALSNNEAVRDYLVAIYSPVEQYIDSEALNWLQGKQAAHNDNMQSIDPATGDIYVFRDKGNGKIDDLANWVNLGPSKRRSE